MAEQISTRDDFLKALLQEIDDLHPLDFEDVLNHVKSVKKERGEGNSIPESAPLKDKAISFAKMYFEDMLFEKDSIVDKFFWDEVDGEKEDLLLDLRDSLSEEVHNYQYVVGEVKGGRGDVNQRTRTVTIAPECTSDDSVLLHELIHVFESYYETHVGFLTFHDVLLISLYNDLKGKLSISNPDVDLDGLIWKRANAESAILLVMQGGEHGVLFLLKSLDLDLRLGYPLETVFGYHEQDEEFDAEGGEDCKAENGSEVENQRTATDGKTAD